MKQRKRIIVGMSGGVDSSVTAHLLVQQGYDVIGVFMRCVNIDGCAERDAEDARRVAGILGIPFYVWDFEREYEARVIRYMLDAYRAGLTPNPDVACNREIKFGLFLERARAHGADGIATGHYARITYRSSRPEALAAARDTNKDQSYFLWDVPRTALPYIHFPLGSLTKPEVRARARAAHLPTAAKKDSQGICFLGNISVGQYLRTQLPQQEGPICTLDGRRIGTHDGAWFFTIGQRHGLRLSAPHSGLGVPASTSTSEPFEPFYVVRRNLEENVLVVAQGHDAPELTARSLVFDGVNVPRRTTPNGTVAVRARIRYRQPLQPATLTINGTQAHLVFNEPQRAVAVGQSAVCYNDADEVVAGGTIIAAA